MTLSRQQIAGLHRDAQVALREGRPRDAHAHCLAILKADRKHADAWFLCGIIAGQNGQNAQAAEILRNAVTLEPSHAEYRVELGKYQLALGHLRDALQTAQETLALSPQDIPTLNTLGTLFSHCGEHEQAIQCFRTAVGQLQNRTPGKVPLSESFRAELYFNMAVSLQFAGDFAAAEESYETAIDLKSDFFKAHSALATLRPQEPDHNHLQRLETLKHQAKSATDRLHLGHAIAKEQEDLGQYDQAMESLHWAKEQQRERMAFDIANDTALFTHIAAACSADKFSSANPPGCDNNEPVFIVGMPRTGTTLVEQILGSHSQVFAAGELQNFPLQVKQLSGTSSKDQLDLQTIEAAESLDMAELGSAYIESTRPRTGHTPCFIDKLPINFMYLGLIRRALPRAKLICLRRDPMDTCLSNYRQLFATNFRHYHYNYDLLDCARYYMEFDRLMAHWQKVMPVTVHELQYENLVQSPEDEVRKLLAFCELPWEDACLKFNERDASVATPSAVQVRQGIYTTSIERWRKYGKAVQPLYDLLHDAGYCV